MSRTNPSERERTTPWASPFTDPPTRGELTFLPAAVVPVRTPEHIGEAMAVVSLPTAAVHAPVLSELRGHTYVRGVDAAGEHGAARARGALGRRRRGGAGALRRPA